MARTRYIKPGFFKNESLAENGPWKRILFAGLWVLADKAGRLEDRPKRIKPDVFPYDDEITSERIDQLLVELASGDDPFIIRYEAGGKRLIQVVKWLGHQSPHRNEAESILPSHRTVKNAEQKSECRPSDEVSTTKDRPEANHSRNDASPNGEWGMGNSNGERGMEDGEPTRNVSDASVDEIPPAWRNEPRPATNVQPRRAHAGCYQSPEACKKGLCIPLFLGQQWEHQAADLPGDQPGPSYVAMFITGVLKFTPSVPQGDPLPWWRDRWDEKHRARRGDHRPAPPSAIGWTDECQELHGGACPTRRDHETRMQRGSAVAS